MKNKPIKRVLRRPHKKQADVICVIDDSGSPMVINMANVQSITAHKTLFGMSNPHVCIVWTNDTWTNLHMESYEDAERLIRDAYSGCRGYYYV